MGNALTITKNVTVGESYDVIVVGGGLRSAKQCVCAAGAESNRGTEDVID